MWGNFNFYCNCVLWRLLIQYILVKCIYFLNLRYGRWWMGICVVRIDPDLQLYLWSPQWCIFIVLHTSPSPSLQPEKLLLSNTFYMLTIFLIHKIAQHLPASIMYYYLFCLFTLTSIRKSECLIVFLSVMWTRTVSNLFLTAQWEENWWHDHDDGILSFRNTKSSRFINGETRMAVVIYLLQIHCFFPHLGSDYLKIEL